MELDRTGHTLEALRDALTSAFPSYDDLAMAVRVTLGEKLADIAPPSAMPIVAFKLITWVEARGRLDELVVGAARQNPTNPALMRFVRELSPSSGAKAEPSTSSSALTERSSGKDAADLASSFLLLPRRGWTPGISSPAALLRAEFGVVPFHGREEEIADLITWCGSPAGIAVRLYTGMGGMGKTRLMLEMCKHLRARGWLAGFVDPQRAPRTTAAWASLREAGHPLFVVVDYAESRGGDLLGPMLEAFVETGPGIARVLLLARAAGEWWDLLRESRGALGEVLAGPASQWFPMRPLALDARARAFSYERALESFARVLDRPASRSDAVDLEEASYDRVLLLHMRALAAVEGVPVKEENGILDYVLRRERRFWRERCSAVGLDPMLVAGIGQAMAVLTLGGGAASPDAAIEILARVPLLAGQTPVVLRAIAGVLHDALPGDDWIEPLQPDILGEHLVENELGRPENAGPLLDILFGPPDP